MKILFIDTESFPSHANFNRIHIRALLNCGNTVDVAFKEGYSKILNISNIKVVCKVPEKLYEHGKETQVYGRFLMLLRLWEVRRKVRFADYDAIFLSYYDETVLPFSFYPSGMYLINHINADGLHHWLKRKLFLHLSARNTQIMISKRAGEYVQGLGVKKTRLVYHGLPNPYNKEVSRPLWMNHRHTLFSPSAMSSDLNFIQDLLNSDAFNDLLISRDVQFVVRSLHPLITNNPNVKVITSFMSDEDYCGCFVHSDAIFVSYVDDFKYRVSAVMLECISNNKKVVVRKTDGLLEYMNLVGEDSYFTTLEQAIRVAEKKIIDSQIPQYDGYLYEPDYTFIKDCSV